MCRLKAYLCKVEIWDTMKPKPLLTVVLLLGAALFCACTNGKLPFSESASPHHFKELSVIEELLETDPGVALDSVMAFRSKAEKTHVTSLDYNELLLREVQAQYKNHVLTETSPDLAPVVVFYDSLVKCYPDNDELQYLLANAYYYKGVEWAYVDEDVKSFSCFLQALAVMDEQKRWDGDHNALRFVALIYTRLFEILYRYGLNDAALENCRKAYSLYTTDVDKAAMIRYEAAIYQSEKEYDKALARFYESEDLAAGDEGFIQLSIGAKLYELQQYDSAFPYLERAFHRGDRFARTDAAAKLSEICQIEGRTEEELRYARYYVEQSLMEPCLASRKMEIEYLYDAFKQSKSEMTAPGEKSSPFSLGLLLVLLVFIALLAFVIVHNRSRIRHIESKISSFEQDRVQETDLVSEPQQIPDDEQPQEKTNKVGFEEAWTAFSNSPVTLRIKQSIEGKDIMIKSVGFYPKLKLKEMDYIELIQEVNRCFPDFSSCFLKCYPELNVSDLRHGCLALLGCNDAEIAVFEGISYSGSNRRSKKILSVLDSGDNMENAMINCLKKFM